MIINMPISLGELVDKISILLIKEKNISDNKKLALIQKELSLLKDTLKKTIKDDKIDFYIKRLFEINTKLWRIEDDIRECERNKDFGNKFIQLARSIYKNNDLRANVKKQINKEFGSKIMEVKSYKEY